MHDLGNVLMQSIHMSIVKPWATTAPTPLLESLVEHTEFPGILVGWFELEDPSGLPWRILVSASKRGTSHLSCIACPGKANTLGNAVHALVLV